MSRARFIFLEYFLSCTDSLQHAANVMSSPAAAKGEFAAQADDFSDMFQTWEVPCASFAAYSRIFLFRLFA